MNKGLKLGIFFYSKNMQILVILVGDDKKVGLRYKKQQLCM